MDVGFYLKIPDVERIGTILVDLADRLPRTMGTESQLSPCVHSMLQILDPDSSFEWTTSDEDRIDFRTSGTNPSLLELVVAPRIIGRRDQSNQLSPSQNAPELKKLSSNNAASRFLLLIDLDREDRDFEPSYRNWVGNNGLAKKVHVVTVGRTGDAKTFVLMPNIEALSA